MSSNYPDNVTGNEFEIAGPDYETEAPRTCEAQNVVLNVISLDAVEQLQQLEIKLGLGAHPNAEPDITLLLNGQRVLHYINEGREVVEVDQCPFAAEVLVSGFRGSEWWSCPLCGTEHDSEVSGE